MPLILWFIIPVALIYLVSALAVSLGFKIFFILFSLPVFLCLLIWIAWKRGDSSKKILIGSLLFVFSMPLFAGGWVLLVGSEAGLSWIKDSLHSSRSTQDSVLCEDVRFNLVESECLKTKSGDAYSARFRVYNEGSPLRGFRVGLQHNTNTFIEQTVNEFFKSGEEKWIGPFTGDTKMTKILITPRVENMVCVDQVIEEDITCL
jgi:hypothetical protein